MYNKISHFSRLPPFHATTASVLPLTRRAAHDKQRTRASSIIIITRVAILIYRHAGSPPVLLESGADWARRITSIFV